MEKKMREKEIWSHSHSTQEGTTMVLPQQSSRILNYHSVTRHQNDTNLGSANDLAAQRAGMLLSILMIGWSLAKSSYTSQPCEGTGPARKH